MTTPAQPIVRHRTAQHRTTLSSPLRHLMDLGFLDGQYSVLDFGCGRGDDVRLLEKLNVPVNGWDPVFRPDGKRETADVVNLGFVLNVIEDASERSRTLRSAFSLARKVLVVSVMLGYAAQRSHFTAHLDGVRTKRNTFQKYFAQDEFRGYVEQTLSSNAVPIAPGICLVFRHQVDEQLFLLARQQIRREWRLLRREPSSDAVAAIIQEHSPHIDAYWRIALDLGRPPALDEYPDPAPLIRLLGSWRRVHDWVGRFFDSEEIEAAKIARQEDLLVYFALSNFGRRRSYAQLPSRLQRDVRFFFGSITKAKAAGKRALYAIADQERVRDAALFCHRELGIGQLSQARDLVLHQSVLGECLPLIRIFVGCALKLFGHAAAVDLIRVHLRSSKVTFLVFDDFENATPPKLIERIKVDLPRLRVDFFDHVAHGNAETLEGHQTDYYQT